MDMSTTSSQIQNTLSTNARIATGYNNYFAIDSNIAVKLASLDPFSETIENSTMSFHLNIRSAECINMIVIRSGSKL